jgi:hypothetical protein
MGSAELRLNGLATGPAIGDAGRGGEIRPDIDAYELLRGIGNLCAGVDGDSRYDARRMVGLLIAGLRQSRPASQGPPSADRPAMSQPYARRVPRSLRSCGSRNSGSEKPRRYISADRRGPYTWVTFDRPDKLNVLHAEDLPRLRDIIVNLDPGVTGLVFTGAGAAAFSAGMNIETFVGMDRRRRRHSSASSAGIMQAIRRSPVVTVAAVSGYCLGGAFELAPLPATSAWSPRRRPSGLPEIKVGVPSVIDAALLPGFVGPSKAREMILTGDTYRLDQLPPHSIANVITEPGLPCRSHRTPA